MGPEYQTVVQGLLEDYSTKVLKYPENHGANMAGSIIHPTMEVLFHRNQDALCEPARAADPLGSRRSFHRV